ncbi:MAG: class I SAM-dependent DNA methyltransferase [Gaiellales bacterium]
MQDYDPMLSFGDEVAALYDDELRGDEADAVRFLSRLAGDGRALELAVGTGRIALPLAAAGVGVDGIDLSDAMVAKLRSKPGGGVVDVTIGDFADVPVGGSYRLIYIVYNTLFNLLTQDDQVRCVENVAAHLDNGGSFVVEALVPSYLHRLRDHQYVDAEAVEVDRVTLDVSRHDPVNQLQEESHVSITRDGIRLHPIVTRYIWPSELDLMARIAGLRLVDRFGGWNDEPFTYDSRLHVSVYGR